VSDLEIPGVGATSAGALPSARWSIAKAEAWTCSFDLPVSLPLGTGGQLRRREYSIVRLSTSDGVEGAAYALGRGVAAPRVITDWLAPFLLGRPVGVISELVDELAVSMASIGADDVVARAISLIDMALWDIMGKVEGQPVYRLLGGDRSEVRVLLGVAPENGEAVGDFVARLGRLVDSGIRAFKVGVSGSHDNLIAHLNQIRSVLGDDVDLVVDAHWALPNIKQAVSFATSLEAFDLAWIEDPFPIYVSSSTTRALRDAIRTPIGCGDEVSRAKMNELMAIDAVDIVRACASTMGGISGSLAVIDHAQSLGMSVSPHVHPEVSRHLALARENVLFVEFYPQGGRFDCADQFIRPLTRVHPGSGAVPAPDRPGLGFDIAWDVVTRHALAGPTSIM